VGGSTFLFQQALKLLTSLTNRLLQYHDQPVWEVLREPNFKPDHSQGGRIFYSKEEIPYLTVNLAEKVGRKESSVLSSVRRLEKRGKVKEVHPGWQRKET